jgi:hypothetical protein
MNIEEAYFETFSEMAILCQLYSTMSFEQIVTTDDTVVSWFHELPADVVDRYKVFLKKYIEHERARGAEARATALDNHAMALGLDVDQE